jgi:hypothetical protein
MRKNVLWRVITALALVVAMGGSLAGCNSNNNVAQNPKTTQNEKTNNNTTKQEVTNNGTKNEETKDEQGQNTPKTPVKAKALYLTGWTVGSMKNVQHYVDLAKTTEINSYVVDIKDDDGLVGYESSIPAVREINAWEKKYNVDRVIKAFHDNGVHVIGRVVCFKDPVLSSKRPDLAIKHVNGGLWKDRKKKTWLSPYNRDSWAYILEIAKEGVKKGFDEI